MNVVVVVQARMTSTRLPGKVLADLAGRPMLARQIERLRRSRRVSSVVLATTDNASDQPLVDLAGGLGVGCFRGPEADVLARYAGAMRAAAADVVVRVTADCPLIEPALVDAVVERLAAGRCDYVSNTRVRSFPRGLDVEAMHADVLCRLDRLATAPAAREHVTWFLHRERPELFVCEDLVDAGDNSDLRWTVDTADDLAMVRALWQAVGARAQEATYGEFLSVARARPDVVALNAHVEQRVDPAPPG